MMAEVLEEEQNFGLGAVVWYHSDKETGWWPCIVTGVRCSDEEGETLPDTYVRLRSLGDCHDYGLEKMMSPQLLPFVCSACKTMIEDQLKRFKQKRRSRVLEDFIAAVKEAIERQPMFQLDIDLPDIDTSLSQSTQSTPENQHGRDYWSVLNDSNFFTRGSDSNSASRLTRSSLRKTLVSLALTKPPTEYHSTPTTTTGSANSDILVRSSRQQRHNRRSGKLSSERKKRKREVTRQEEKDEEEDSISDYEDPVPVKKLNLDESVDAITPDILTACEGFNPVQTPHNGADSTGECRDGVGGGNGVSGDGEMCASAEVALTTSYQLSASCSGTTTEAEGVSESELERRREERGGREREKEREADEVEREGERGENGEGERESGEGGREGEGEREGVEGERETTEEDEESDSSDDDLPSFLTNTGTKIVVNNLKEGNHIWSKYQTFPHWPALVVKVHPAKKSSNARAKIVYFGDNPDHDPVTLRHRHRRNLARFVFGNQQFQEFMKAGRECGTHAEFFARSVKEAETFITAKCNKELSGSALEMFKQICDRRPPSQMAGISWMDKSLHLQKNEKPTVSAFGYRLDPEFMDTEDRGEGGSESSEDASESEEEEDPKYSLDKVCSYFNNELKPTLQGIMCGSVESEYNRLFTCGTTKEKYQLGNCRKYGPCRKWNTDKKHALIRCLENIAKETVAITSTFIYSRDVLLPEAMIRTISHFEGISQDEARKKL